MAPIVAPGPDLQNLSCNWKKLQAELPPKRKRPDAESHPHLFSKAKRPRKDPGQDYSQARTQSFLPNDGKAKNSHKGPSSASLALWAADNNIPRKDILAAYGDAVEKSPASLELNLCEDVNAGLSTTAEPGKYLAIDCEMVGVGPTPDRESALARVSVVNFHGHQLYDSFVQPKESVTDYRTRVSGITEVLLRGARSLEVVQADIAKLLDGKILVGHSVRSDLEALFLSHPSRDIRDTSKHPPFRQLANGRTPGLRRLARDILGLDIQSGEHSSVEDARATMMIFRKEKASFDSEHLARWGIDKRTESHRQEPKKGTATEKKKSKSKNKKKKKKQGK